MSQTILETREYFVRVPKGMGHKRLPIREDNGSLYISNRGMFYVALSSASPIGLLVISIYVLITSNWNDIGLALMLFGIGTPFLILAFFQYFAYETIRVNFDLQTVETTDHKFLRQSKTSSDLEDLFISPCRVRCRDRKPNRVGLLIGVQHTGRALLYSCGKRAGTVEEAILTIPPQLQPYLIQDEPIACIMNF